jgi:hypothetical protein
MQRKTILIPLIALLAVGAVWASSMITPDKPWFPSLPSSPGTLGSILSLFGVDGTARDAVLLDGKSATGYVQNTVCNAWEVWKGIDATGKVICGTKSKVLTQVGRITAIGWVVTVITEEWAASRAAVVWDILKEWATLQTLWGASATVTFTDDLSILRLDQNTRVDIRLPATPTSTSIASVIVNDGVIWWRVLTSSGVEFGGWGLIAGVRGTSLSVAKLNATGYQFTIPHSQRGSEAASMKLATDANTTRTLGTLSQLTTYTPTGTTTTNIPTPSSLWSLKSLYDIDPWVRENTVLDLNYLYGLGSSSLIQQEIAATEPIVIADRRAVCGAQLDQTSGSGIWDKWAWACVYAYADYTSGDTDMHLGIRDIPIDLSKTEPLNPPSVRDDHNFRVGGFWNNGNWEYAGKPCWSEVNNTTKIYSLPCIRDNARIHPNGYPFADLLQAKMDLGYTHLRVDIAGSTEEWASGWNWATYKSITFLWSITPDSGGGIPIDETGESISYATWALGSLAGKTITIELGGAPTVANWVLAYHSSSIQVLYSNTTSWTCVGCTIVSSSSTRLSYTLPSTWTSISNFIVWNNRNWNLPISAKIQKIVIQ